MGLQGSVSGMGLALGSAAANAVAAFDPAVLALTSEIGFRQTATKLIGTDALPSGASVGSGATSNTVTLAGSGGTFSGWDMTNHVVKVTAPGWTIEDNNIHLGTNKPNSATYVIDIQASNTIIRFNEIDGNYGRNVSTHINIGQGAYIGVKVYRNRFLNPASDTIKVQTTVTAIADIPEIYENYGTIGGWGLDSDYALGNIAPHFDWITVSSGGANIHHNFPDLTAYVGPATAAGATPGTVNIPPPGAPAGYYTYGLTSCLRVQAPNDGTTVIDNVIFDHNLVRGHKRGGFYPLQIVSYGVPKSVVVTNNTIEEGTNNGLGHATLPANPQFSLTFSGNKRYSDNVGFSSWVGATGVVPSAPVLRGLVGIGQTSAILYFDRGGDATAGSHQYALSTNGGTSFGSWIAVPSNKTITGLSPSVSYVVKLRASNAAGFGPESSTSSFTTAAIPTPAVPENTASPTISPSSPKVGDTLSLAGDTWSNSPMSYLYQWQRSADAGSTWSDISGAADATYVTTGTDASLKIRGRKIAVNGAGQSAAAYSDALTIAPSYSSPTRYSIAGSGRLRLPGSTKAVTVNAGGTGASTTYALSMTRWHMSAPDYPTSDWCFVLSTDAHSSNAENRMTTGKTVIVQSTMLRYSTDGGTNWSAFYECDGAAESGVGTFDSTAPIYIAPRIQATVPANALIEGRIITKQPVGATLPDHRVGLLANGAPGLTTLTENVYTLGDSNADGTLGTMWAKRFTLLSIPPGATAGSGTTGSAALQPCRCYAKGGDGRAVVEIAGDSGMGTGTADSSVATMLGRNLDLTPSGRLVFGFIDRGFDDNSDTKRISTGNIGVAGSDPVQFAKDIYDGTSRKFQALQIIQTTLGHCGFDVLFNGHFGNSANNTPFDDGSAPGAIVRAAPGVYNAVGYINAQFASAFGCKVIQSTSNLLISSTDVFATLVNQSPGAGASTYPSSTPFGSVSYDIPTKTGNSAYNGLGASWKWIYLLTKYGSITGSAPDRTARFFADYPAILADVCEPYLEEIYDKTPANIDAVKLLATNEPGFSNGEALSGTFASAYASGFTLVLDFKPRVGGSLIWIDDGGGRRGGYIGAVTGTGPYNVTVALFSSNSGATSAGRAVRESHAAADDVHRSPLIHTTRYPYSVIKTKKRLAAYGMV